MTFYELYPEAIRLARKAFGENEHVAIELQADDYSAQYGGRHPEITWCIYTPATGHLKASSAEKVLADFQVALDKLSSTDDLKHLTRADRCIGCGSERDE